MNDPVLFHFSYSHLPAELQEVSKKFHDLAHEIHNTTAPGKQREIALQRLLESKDAAVRARREVGMTNGA